MEGDFNTPRRLSPKEKLDQLNDVRHSLTDRKLAKQQILSNWQIGQPPVANLVRFNELKAVRERHNEFYHRPDETASQERRDR